MNLKPFEKLIHRIDDSLSSLDNSRKALFFLVNGTRFLPLYDKYCQKTGLNDNIRFKEIVNDLWKNISAVPDSKLTGALLQAVESINVDGIKYMIPEVSNAQWTVACVWDAIGYYMGKQEKASVFPCLVPMYQSVDNVIHSDKVIPIGTKIEDLENEIILNKKFILEKQKVENCIEELGNDGRAFPDIVEYWKGRAWDDLVNPDDYWPIQEKYK